MIKSSIKKIYLSLVIAFITFSLIFSGLYFDFWLQMTFTVLILAFIAFMNFGDDLKKQLKASSSELIFSVLLGTLAAIFLYFIFFIGNDLAGQMFFSGKANISNIYNFGQGVDSRMILFLLLFIIGPGEEIFWRGYIQKSMTKEYGRLGVGFTIIVYAIVHLASGNFILIIAALVGGIFWGILYYYYKNLWANIICHAFWDVTIFVLWPFS